MKNMGRIFMNCSIGPNVLVCCFFHYQIVGQNFTNYSIGPIESFQLMLEAFSKDYFGSHAKPSQTSFPM